MRSIHILLLILTVSLTAGCGPRDPQVLGDAEYRAATGASSTVTEVALALGTLTTDGLIQAAPYMVRILTAAAGNLEIALQTAEVVETKPEILGTPLATADSIRNDAPAAADAAETEAAVRDRASAEEQTATWWEKVLEWSGWGFLAGAGLWAARLLGVPGVQYLSDPLVRQLGGKWLQPLEAKAIEAEGKIRTFTATVESSMVGRTALSALDQLLGDRLPAAEIRRLTHGEASTIEELFVYFARGHAIDSPAIDSTAIKDIIDQIKDRMETRGGLAASVAGVLDGLMAQSPAPGPARA